MPRLGTDCNEQEREWPLLQAGSTGATLRNMVESVWRTNFSQFPMSTTTPTMSANITASNVELLLGWFTPADLDGTPWFGFERLKAEFEDVFVRSMKEEPRLCVLNRGRFGSGKTHAAKHFNARVSRQEDFGVYHRCVAILVEAPKQPAKAFSEFTTRLLNTVTVRRIMEAAKNLRALSDVDEVFTKLLEATGSEDIATVLSRIDDANVLLSKTFLLGGGTAAELRKLGVAKKLSTDHELATAITGVFALLMHGQSSDRPTISRVVLWMDEMEDLVFFPTRYYLPFTQAIREILDRHASHLTVFWNFTFSEPEDLPAIENVLGQAIMQRVNQHIVFREASSGDMCKYLKELLAYNRLNPDGYPEAFPFSAESVDRLVQASVSKTPRFMNKLCDSLLRKILTECGTDLQAGEVIPDAIIRDRLPEVLALLEDVRG
jgi:hypothetical protein